MNRFTYYDGLNVGCYLWDKPGGDTVMTNPAIRKLAAYEDTGLTPEEVAELARAKAEERIIIMPFRIGEIVYEVIPNNYHTKSRLGKPYIEERKIGYDWLKEIGKSIFATREEAEAALERRKTNE